MNVSHKISRSLFLRNQGPKRKAPRCTTLLANIYSWKVSWQWVQQRWLNTWHNLFGSFSHLIKGLNLAFNGRRETPGENLHLLYYIPVRFHNRKSNSFSWALDINFFGSYFDLIRGHYSIFPGRRETKLHLLIFTTGQQNDRLSDRLSNRQTDRRTDRQTDRLTYGQEQTYVPPNASIVKSVRFIYICPINL